MNVKKYYKVTCKCGHTGSKKTYIPITFPVVAINGKEAASIARMIPRCKHNHKYCVLNVEECSYSEYILQEKVNSENPYLKCKCIQDQKLLNLDDLFVEDPHAYKVEKELKFEDGIHKSYFYGKERIRKPKQYMKNIYQSNQNYLEAY